MNPISIFFCYDAEGERVETVVAEVNNTPWKQQHCYVLPSGSGIGRAMRFRNGKAFHVSPFLGMEMDYLWRVTPPGERLSVRIENQVHGQTLFDAVLQLKRREISTGSLARHAVRFPLNTLKVFLAIYWQAMHLWRKGVPYVPHPGLSPSMDSNGGIEPSKISDS